MAGSCHFLINNFLTNDIFTVTNLIMWKRKEIDYNNKVVSLDIEATGYGRLTDVIQFSMINENRKSLFNIYTRPKKFTEKFLKKQLKRTSKLNRITFDKIKDRPPLYNYRESIQKYLNSADIIIGFAIKNDLLWLNQNKIFIEEGKKIIDVQLLFKIYMYVQKDHPDWYKLLTLEKCCAYCDYGEKTKARRFHNSLGDAEATMFCYEYLQCHYLNLDVGLTDSKGNQLFTKKDVDKNFATLKRQSSLLKDFSCILAD